MHSGWVVVGGYVLYQSVSVTVICRICAIEVPRDLWFMYKNGSCITSMLTICLLVHASSDSKHCIELSYPVLSCSALCTAVLDSRTM